MHSNDSARLRPVQLGLLLVLLIAPAIAGWRLGVGDAKWVLPACYVGASTLTFFLYATDKRRARAGEWRVPENILHFLEFTGGWPGGFLAQRWLRHKSSKASYQVVFWLIVTIHQFAAVDYLRDWSMTRAAVQAVRGLTESVGTNK
ncbi:MAG: DUF1294 domain-containing protein [Opitutaceae bacterium]